MRGNKVEILSKLSLLVTMMIITMVKSSSLNYSDALTKSILFFEGQRSGPLPPSQRMKWRKDSALNDGSDIYVFDFANNYRGSYNDSIGDGACPFYCDINGYMDELVWGAAWLYKASNDQSYLNFVKSNMQFIRSIDDFGWDSKDAGINILASQWAMKDPSNQNPFITNADNFICHLLPDSPNKRVTYSKGGLLFIPGPSNMQHVASYSFLLIVYARYMEANNKIVNCGDVVAKPYDLDNLAKTQVDYVLGNNPLGMSYMVGYGEKYPQKIHHRGSIIPSIDVYPGHIGCRDGDKYFQSETPNINVLTGAIVGGPADDDSFQDSRYNVSQSEPTTYINAPFVGVFAYFKQLNST
ncbi:hypothetical protein KIW84_076960 [Lathyrus oleraceus]|uniref:Endoglucanase n=1 Tax=Pisum sativum TaxID=3888 RepID=A0A9D4W0K4_PEA|nr:hypothetical protein KIW84_076960 [Pisum sativum]